MTPLQSKDISIGPTLWQHLGHIGVFVMLCFPWPNHTEWVYNWIVSDWYTKQSEVPTTTKPNQILIKRSLKQSQSSDMGICTIEQQGNYNIYIPTFDLSSPKKDLSVFYKVCINTCRRYFCFGVLIILVIVRAVLRGCFQLRNIK